MNEALPEQSGTDRRHTDGAGQKYLAEFADIPEAAKHARMADGGKTPSEHLAYQLGWVAALLNWKRREQAGEAVQTPAPGYKWNALGDLNQHYYHTYGALTLARQQTVLRGKVAALYAWINDLSDNEPFLPAQRQWATTAAQWPLWKMDTHQHRRPVYQLPHPNSQIEDRDIARSIERSLLTHPYHLYPLSFLHRNPPYP